MYNLELKVSKLIVEIFTKYFPDVADTIVIRVAIYGFSSILFGITGNCLISVFFDDIELIKLRLFCFVQFFVAYTHICYDFKIR